MAYPPSPLPTDATDGTSASDTTPTAVLTVAEVNATNAAVNDIVAELGSNPSGTDATVAARLDGIESDITSLGSGSIPDGSVSTAKLADGAVTAAKVAADVATQAELDAETAARTAAIAGLSGTYARKVADWATGVAYAVGELVSSGGTLYRCTVAHTSSGSFAAGNFSAVSGGGGAVSSVVGQTGAVTGAQIVADTTVAAALAGKAPLASPALTGTPTVPTAAADTNSTQAASTAFVLGQAGSATPLVDGTAAAGTSPRLARQDHVHPTDTSRAAATHVHAAGDITSGTVAAARLGAGTASASTFLRGDGQWAAPAGGGATAPTDRGAWATATSYAVRDVVTEAGVRYECAAAHTSGTFATDLAASRWVPLDVGVAVPLAISGQTPAQEPVSPGVASVGSLAYAARADHVHPDVALSTPPRTFHMVGAIPTSRSLNGRLYVVRAVGSGVIGNIRIRVQTSSGNLAVGVYGNTGSGYLARPTGAPKMSSGTIACPATGISDIALTATVTVQPGDWFAIIADNNTATFWTLGSALFSGLADGLCGYYVQAGAALPTIGGSWVAEDVAPIMIGL